MTLLQVLLLALVQGFCELLPVSSSAHVIMAEKLMGLDPSAPAMTLLLVALHTGTMFAVILYFRHQWYEAYFSSRRAFLANAAHVLVATLATGVVGVALLKLLPVALGVAPDTFEVEQLFDNPRLIAAALAAAGLLIIAAGLLGRAGSGRADLARPSALLIGAVQGLCLPFRGFSRSGATISTGLLLGVAREKAESFSFALAVVLTPAVIIKEVHRFLKAHATLGDGGLVQLAWPSLVGMVLAFGAGLLALRWLSGWLERGRWHFFGFYCLAAAAGVLLVLR